MIHLSLIFGKGNLNTGFNSIIARISPKNGSIPEQYHGSLPSCESIVELQKKWIFLYESLLGRFSRGKFEIDETEGFTPNISIINLEQTATEIAKNLNDWLANESFREIDRTLLQLSKNEPIRLTIETEDSQLIRLPWHLWRFCQDNPQIGFGFSPLNRHTVNFSNSDSLKILSILGDSTGIDLEGDRASLQSIIKQYQNTELKFLQEPSRQEFNEQLWEEKWDILFFAGHSKSNSISGEIAINPHETITIEQLKHSLKRAIQQGLKLAIFNSCDGLGLATALADLQLPQIIVMQEDVPNEVAQQFLKYFLKSLTEGKNIEIAKREAQEKLQGLEGKYAGATWLPVLFQHPEIHWHPFPVVKSQEIKTESEAINWVEFCQNLIDKQKQLTTNPLTLNEGRFNLDNIFVPLGLLERKKKEKKDKNSGGIEAEKGSTLYNSGNKFPTVATIIDIDFESSNHNDKQRQEETEEITREYSHDEFFSEVLAKGESPKSKGKRIAIIGEPGAGKTTQLQKIANWVLSQNQIPVWVSLADLQGKTIEEYLLQIWLKDALKVARVTPEQENELVELFNQGQVWLLLDGVDEMGETNPLAEINHQLRGWLTSAKIVVTCRVNVWDAGKNYLQEFDIYRNLDVSEELREEFVNKWFSHQPDLAESLESALNQTGKERIKDLVRNPLRLTLLCSFWQRRQGDLPETKAGLYQQFVKVFYEWKEEYFPTTPKQRRELNQALGVLAREAIDKSNSRFRLTHSEVCQYLGDEDSESFNLAIDLGWLNQVGVAAENPDEVVYAFYHPTFQEYFAALTVDDWHFFLTHIPDNPSEGIYRIFEPQWKEVYLLWLGRNDINDQQKEELIDAIYNFNDNCGNFYYFRGFLQAVIGVGEFKQSKLADKIIDELIKISFGYFDEDEDNWRNFVSWQQQTCETYLEQTDTQKIIEKLCKLWLKITSQDSISALNSVNKKIESTLKKLASNNYTLTYNTLVFFAEQNQWQNFLNILDLPIIPSFPNGDSYIDSYIEEINQNKRYLERVIDSYIKNQLIKIKEEVKDTKLQIQKIQIIIFLFTLDIYNQKDIEYLINIVHQNNTYSLSALRFFTTFSSQFKNILEQLLEDLSQNDDKFLNYDLISRIYKSLDQTKDDRDNNSDFKQYINYTLDNCEDKNILIQASEDLLIIDPQNQKANNQLLSIILQEPNRLKINTEIDYILECLSYLSQEEVEVSSNSIDSIDSNIDTLLEQFLQNIKSKKISIEISIAQISDIDELKKHEIHQLIERLIKDFDKIKPKRINRSEIRSYFPSLNDYKPLNDYKLLDLAILILKFYPEDIDIINKLSIFIEHDDVLLSLCSIEILKTYNIYEKNKDLLNLSIKRLKLIIEKLIIEKNNSSFFPEYSLSEKLIKSLIKKYYVEEQITNNKEQNLINLLNQNILSIKEIINLYLEHNTPSITLLSWIKNKAEDNYFSKKNAQKYGLKFFYATVLIRTKINVDEGINIFKEILSTNYLKQQTIKFLLENNLLINECAFKVGQLINSLCEQIKNCNVQEDNFTFNFDLVTNLINLFDEYNLMNNLNIENFIQLLTHCFIDENDEDKKLEFAQKIINFEPNNRDVIHFSINLLLFSQKWFYNHSREANYIEYHCETAVSILIKANLTNSLNDIIYSLKNCLLDEFGNQKNIEGYRQKFINEFLWHCATNYKYSEFYQAWHCQPNIHPEMREIIPVGENNLTQTLLQQISVNSLKQLQSTDAVYPIIIDLFTLAGETEQKEIVLEISYQIYQQVFPNDADIPEINNAPQLKRIVPKIKQYLQKEKIILIFYNYDPYPELVNFCQKISDSFNLGWVTTKPVESFIRGFLPNQTNLLTVMQNWLNDL